MRFRGQDGAQVARRNAAESERLIELLRLAARSDRGIERSADELGMPGNERKCRLTYRPSISGQIGTSFY